MRSFFNKAAALFLALVLCLGIADPALTKVSAEEAVTSTSAETGKDFLKKVIGEYVPLFEGASFEAKYDHYWHDYSAAVAGESMADMCTAIGEAAPDDAGRPLYVTFLCYLLNIPSLCVPSLKAKKPLFVWFRTHREHLIPRLIYYGLKSCLIRFCIGHKTALSLCV